MSTSTDNIQPHSTADMLRLFSADNLLSNRIDLLTSIGGMSKLEKILKTDYKGGLNDGDDITVRKGIYGINYITPSDGKSFFTLLVESFDDETLKILIIAAVISLLIGIWQDPAAGWIEGAAILFAVLLVAIVTSVNNYNRDLQFRRLNEKKEDVEYSVTRSSKTVLVNVKDIVVGDVVNLETGDKIPADGIFITGSDVKCNESEYNGESDDVAKVEHSSDNHLADSFMISGTTMSSGSCKMLVTGVGINSSWGMIQNNIREREGEERKTPLQEKLEVLANQIGDYGTRTAIVTFVAVVGMYYFYPESRDDRNDLDSPQWEKLFNFVLKAFIMSVTIVVVAVPEGLPLAVTLSLAYSSQKMMSDHNLIRYLDACETMGNATNICSDKTGTLTQNVMTVTEGWIGDTYYTEMPSSDQLAPALVTSIIENVCINSTAVVMDNSVKGSKTEGALLQMVKKCYNKDYVTVRESGFDSRRDQLFSFSSSRKRMSVLLQVNGQNKLYTKGAAEIIVSLCSHYTASNGTMTILKSDKKQEILNKINVMAQDQLRTIAIAHSYTTTMKGSKPKTYSADEVEVGLVLDAIFGIQDPLRPDVVAAVGECQRAGIFVRMVTGDNINTAKAIAKKCGIYTEGGLAMEGPEFRKLSLKELDDILPRLQVLARSSPEDKYMLVCRLNGNGLPKDQKEWEEKHPGSDWKARDLILPGYFEEWSTSRGGNGEVVGVTGDGTNDAPALKAGDVGLSMGISGTDVAKDASDIVIMDDKFSSIVAAVKWGRSVFDNIRKFLQFQLTVNVVALSITFVSAVTGQEPPLNAVMMLWVNMIMDTMGALALGTEPPSSALLHRKPYKKSANLISNKMFRNIFIQYLFQMVLLGYLLIGKDAIDNFSDVPGQGISKEQHITIVFNIFVFCQVFNEINARSIGDDCNVFKGLFTNPLFMSIIAFTVTAQFFIVEYGGAFVKTAHLTHDQWIKSVLLGSLSLTVGGIMRLIPVRDDDNDFAPIATLMEKNRSIADRDNKLKDSKERSSFSLSYLAWLSCVIIIPLLCYQQFINQDFKVLY